ncbi:GNAT family N-acetyltransferase [Undibacterium sp. SXout11W]|uniref:GNAT family N-acetyltransferase n=1 Tax=Undibacterium sp. SXout11W TaxID=3413050 RepID=UPI003BEF826E
MKFSLISGGELDAGLHKAWLQMLNNSAILQSPYYHPKYTTIIGAARADTRILVIEDAGEVIGFFPHHKKNAFVAEVIGGGLTDYQGPIFSANRELSIKQMLAAMNVRYMGFNHMPSDRTEFAKYAWDHSRSLTLNLDGGFEAYIQRLSERRDASLFKKIETNERKLSKKFGPLRFCFDARDPAEFSALLAGKSNQFIRTLGADHDIFAVPWIKTVVEGINQQKQADFAGVLSTLYAGDTLIAAHFGMRSASVLHYWFPWYETVFSEFSPGLILLAGCAREAPATGITSIDLGRGEQAYKLRFATGHIDLCEGAISSPALLSKSKADYLTLRSDLKNSRLGNYLRNLKQKKKAAL